MTTRVHHLNAGTFLPPVVGRMIAHVLVLERPGGLVLVDTGFGTADVADPGRLGRPFRLMMKPALDPAEPVVRQLPGLGLDPADVTDIVLTHLDLDHAGGLSDFPRATVHVHARELDAARHPHISERMRYVAAQWRDARFETHETAGDSWHGFESVTVLDDDVLIVPLHGHSRGHSGVAVRSGDQWLLHAGDAYFHRGDVATPPAGTRMLGITQKLLAVDDRLRRANQERLRELVGRGEVRVFSAHDPVEFAALSD